MSERTILEDALANGPPEGTEFLRYDAFNSIWVSLAFDDWARFHLGGQSLAGVTGDTYFVVVVADDKGIMNFIIHRYLVDAHGRKATRNLLTEDEYRRLDQLWFAQALSSEQQREFDSLRDKDWQASIPPADAVRTLLLQLGRPVQQSGGAYQLLSAIGINRELLGNIHPTTQ